jgi:phosphoribosylanthranilate isomerase
MKMFKVKVCGIKSADIVQALNSCRPDYVGYILSSGFKRSVTTLTALEIRQKLSPDIPTVGVFVNEKIEEIARLYLLGLFSIIQLHGDENVEYINKVKKVCDLPIIKSVGVNCGEVMAYPNNCDFVLLDTYSRTQRGGMGERVEWKKYDKIEKPIFLAGGITPENVTEALKAVQPYAVDCSSGVESDGVKDADKIKRYIEAVRNCN